MHLHPLDQLRVDQTATDRFWQKVKKTETCWVWLGSVNQGGYGRFRFSGSVWMAHRWLYTLLRGPIPEGLTLDHLCSNRACVNPSHLEPVTLAENIRRGGSPTAINRRKMHCPSGHSYSGDNLIIYRSARYCRACMRARDGRRSDRTVAAL